VPLADEVKDTTVVASDEADLLDLAWIDAANKKSDAPLIIDLDD
jgi:hypothetical protein